MCARQRFLKPMAKKSIQGFARAFARRIFARNRFGAPPLRCCAASCMSPVAVSVLPKPLDHHAVSLMMPDDRKVVLIPGDVEAFVFNLPTCLRCSRQNAAAMVLLTILLSHIASITVPTGLVYRYCKPRIDFKSRVSHGREISFQSSKVSFSSLGLVRRGRCALSRTRRSVVAGRALLGASRMWRPVSTRHCTSPIHPWGMRMTRSTLSDMKVRDKTGCP